MTAIPNALIPFEYWKICIILIKRINTNNVRGINDSKTTEITAVTTITNDNIFQKLLKKPVIPYALKSNINSNI